MANFTAQLAFIDLKSGPAPKMTDLLFFNLEARLDNQSQHYARGWVSEEGQVILIGAQWEPTHYAHVPDFYAAADSAQQASEAGGGDQKDGANKK